MSDPKQRHPSPQVLAYMHGRADDGRSYNRWWMVSLRILGGVVAGTASVLAGVALFGLTHVQSLLFAPALVVLALFLFVAIRFRRFGYVTGLIISPFLLAVAIFWMLMQACSHGWGR